MTSIHNEVQWLPESKARWSEGMPLEKLSNVDVISESIFKTEVHTNHNS